MPKKRDKNKIKAVTKEYLRNGLNMTAALRKIEGKSLPSSKVKAHKWRNAEEVKREIQREVEKFDKKLITPEYVLFHLDSIIKDNGAKNSDKVQALALVGKYLSLFKEEAKIQNIAISPNISNQDIDTRIRELYHKRFKDKDLDNNTG